MAKKKARTRKEMFDMLSPEEQESALKEMTFPYPMSEAVEPDVAEKEMRRRFDKDVGFLDYMGLGERDKFKSYRRDLEHDEDGQQRELVQMVKNQAARMIVDAVKDQIDTDDFKKEISRHPSIPEGYKDSRWDESGKLQGFGSNLAKNAEHYNKYPKGKYAVGPNKLPDSEMDELIDMDAVQSRNPFSLNKELILSDGQAKKVYHKTGNELYNRKKKKGKK